MSELILYIYKQRIVENIYSDQFNDSFVYNNNIFGFL